MLANVLKSFWSFFLVSRDNSPRNGRASIKGLFSAVRTWGLFKYNWSKNVLKHLSMDDIGYPLFKSRAFRNANSLWS